METPLIIAGATATGKSAVAQWIAERTGAAIVSADSMLVYRGMDIGTAKPTAAERRRVRYIGLDCVEPGERFSTGDWLGNVAAGVAALPPGTPLVVAGGTGLYIKALLEGLDAPPSAPAAREEARRIYEAGGVEALKAEVARRGVAVPPGDAANPRRLMRALEKAAARAEPGPRAACVQPQAADLRRIFAGARRFLLVMDRDALAARIEARARLMFEEGIVDEALRVFGGGAASETAAGAIGYAEALAVARHPARTRQLAKRQRTWFRHQLEAEEVAVGPGDTAEEVAGRILGRLGEALKKEKV